jgi:hypothetical protein
MFFVSNPKGIEGTQGDLPALSLACGNDFSPVTGKRP